MLRRCLQRASRLHNLRNNSRSSIATATGQHSSLYDYRIAAATAVNGQKRSYGLSRHPDPLAVHGDLNTAEDDDADDKEDKKVYTADDLEYEELKNWADSTDIPLDDIFESSPDDANNSGGGINHPFNPTKQRQLTQAEIEYRERQSKIERELDQRTGRLWEERWTISDEEWMSTDTWEDIEDWSLKMATRKALESVKVWDAGVPTLQQLSNLHLPPSLPSHPGHGNPSIHAKARKKHINKRLQTTIQLCAADDLARILSMSSWEEKQEAVDALFEVIEERVKEKEPILAKLPDFKEKVEDGLEQVLRMVQSRARGIHKKNDVDANDKNATNEEESGDSSNTTSPPPLEQKTKQELENVIDVMGIKQDPAVPVFMDLLKAAKSQENKSASTSTDDKGESNTNSKKSLSTFFTQSNESNVPNLIYPLNVHHNDGVGRMVEEWELAANKETKRIMMRDGMKEIAAKIVEAAHCCNDDMVEEDEKGAARVFVTGKRGVGKTAALAGLVASARISGHIVVYLPDGDRLRKHGFYIEPCSYRTGYYNLPEIAKEFCEQLLTSHGDDVQDMIVSKDDMAAYLSEDQITRLFTRSSEDDAENKGDASTSPNELSLNKILEVGMGSTSLASGCYSMVISMLMNQTKKPFTVVMDEFNCYYDHGHYFHMDYDEKVSKPIPINKITIFKPFLDAMGLYPTEAGNDITPNESSAEPTPMKWGSMIVGMSESRAVRQSFTQALTESARAQSQRDNSFHVVDLQRFNDVEVQHVLYNFECTGIGRLRFDRGYTTLNPDEVEYLRMVSGGIGQRLVEACLLP